MFDDGDFELLDAYEDALMNDAVEEIRTRVSIDRRALEYLDPNDYGDRLAEAAGWPLLMNVRHRFIEFKDGMAVYEITGLNPL